MFVISGDLFSWRHVLLRAALQRLARLDDQLEQQRAALGARGRQRRMKSDLNPWLPKRYLDRTDSNHHKTDFICKRLLVEALKMRGVLVAQAKEPGHSGR